MSKKGKPKRDGSGKGTSANRGRGGCPPAKRPAPKRKPRNRR